MRTVTCRARDISNSDGSFVYHVVCISGLVVLTEFGYADTGALIAESKNRATL